MVGVVNGTFDAAADDWSSDTHSNVLRMEAKGMVPKGSTRIIWKSGLIPNGPYVTRTDLPADLQADFTAALMAVAKDAPDVYRGVVGADEVEGRPGLVVERAPDRVVAVEDDHDRALVKVNVVLDLRQHALVE